MRALSAREGYGLSLRNRLWLVVGALVLVPLLAGGLVAVLLVARAADQRVLGVLRAEVGSVSALVVSECEQVGLAARSLGAEAAAGSPAQAAGSVADTQYADYAALLDADDNLIASAGTPPADVAALSSCTQPEAPGAFLAERVAVTGAGSSGVATALVARYVDMAFLRAIDGATPSRLATTLARNGAVVASTADPAVAAVLAEAAGVAVGASATGGAGAPESARNAVSSGEIDGWLYSASAPAPGNPFTVVVADKAPPTAPLQQSLLAGVALVAAVTLVLGWHLARQLTRPLAELTTAAERVAAGDLDQTLEVRRDDETGRLASSFNRMTRELRRNMNALSRSRDDLRSSLERLGGALSSTHDLDQLLQVVVDTAAATAGARAGAAWAADGAGTLRLAATHGPTRDLPPVVDADRGDLLGRVVARGELDQEDDRIAVPLLRGERVVGLLELAGGRDGTTLDPAAAGPLQALANQAGIAVDNVIVHREAERLAVTDPLTGLWNFRYLSMSLSREIERATRFDRPLAVLMLDIDHFKDVNDTYGHAQGDAVLRELAARVSEQIREVDTLARYGGEEFVLVLPETTVEGAGILAERIVGSVRRQPFSLEDGRQIRVTVSVGVAAFPGHGASAATLMHAADGALYAAKNSGRDRWKTAAA